MKKGPTYLRIEDYGIIGDLHTTALVGKNGSIDFLCFPEFDSPSVFAALLDHQKGGFFQISPNIEDSTPKQMYLPDTNILLTRFLGLQGIGEISDFMILPEKGEKQCLIRRAKAIRGEITFTCRCEPRFNYGRTPHQVRAEGSTALFLPEEGNLPSLRLTTDASLQATPQGVETTFHLKAGESAWFVLEELEESEASKTLDETYVSQKFKSTLNAWHDWASQSTYQGRWREMVTRSALTLKLLTSQKYGSVIAAPTFGLPEQIGLERNWDYRYTWIRDGAFTLYSLMRLGYHFEAGQFMKWVDARCHNLNSDGSLQIMYGIDGRKELTEEILEEWEGYMGSKPVRIGNAAYAQKQLDIYGELMDSIYLYNKYGAPISADLWENIIRLLGWVSKNWTSKGEGIWEVRAGPREFLYSRLMCWVALDRGIRIARNRSFPAPVAEWKKVRDTIYQTILNDFWNPKLQAFVQYRGGDSLDASVLLMPLVKFIGPTDPKWLSTLSAIEKNLLDDSLVYRYKTGDKEVDGLIGQEGTFTMCSFWYVECLARAGDVKKARFYFEKILSYSNSLGLFSEEIGLDGRQLGNYPQAFTHLSLISAAVNLDASLNKVGELDWDRKSL